MAPMDDFEIYVELWRRAEREGVTVRYEDDPCASGRHGYFDSHRHDDTPSPPEIVVVRPWFTPPVTEPQRESGAPQKVSKILDELITLAHEFGHFRSYTTARERWLQFDDAVQHRQRVETVASLTAITTSQLPAEQNEIIRHALRAALNDHERALIIDEEALAWDIARETLASLGFDKWEPFEARVRSGLHFHRWRLGIEDAMGGR